MYNDAKVAGTDKASLGKGYIYIYRRIDWTFINNILVVYQLINDQISIESI